MARKTDLYRYWGVKLRAPKRAKLPTERKVTKYFGGYDFPTSLEEIKAWLDKELGTLADGSMDVYSEDDYGSHRVVVSMSGWEPINERLASELLAQYEGEVAAIEARNREQDEKQLALLKQRRPDLFEGEQ